MKNELLKARLTGNKEKVKEIFRFYSELKDFHYILTNEKYPEYKDVYSFKKYRWVLEELAVKEEINEALITPFRAID